MTGKSVRPARRLQSEPLKAADDCINRALAKSDIAEICYAIGAARVLVSAQFMALFQLPAAVKSTRCTQQKTARGRSVCVCGRLRASPRAGR